jgi:hypothetical protein
MVLVSTVLAGVLLAAGAGYLLWSGSGTPSTGSARAEARTALAGSTRPTVPEPDNYKGYVNVTIWRTERGQDWRMELTDEKAVPLQDGDGFRIEAKVTPAAYLYLFGIDTEGKVTPVYPWDPHVGWGTRPVQESRREVLNLPETETEGWSFKGGKEGMEAFVLLARPTPLEADDETVRGWFKDVKPQKPVHNMRSAVWFDNGLLVTNDPGRTRANFNEREIDDPVLRLQKLLRELKQGKAPFTTAVIIAKQGKQ